MWPEWWGWEQRLLQEVALGGLRKAQLALHVKNKMLVCCLYLCFVSFSICFSWTPGLGLGSSFGCLKEKHIQDYVLSAAVSSGSLHSRDREHLWVVTLWRQLLLSLRIFRNTFSFQGKCRAGEGRQTNTWGQRGALCCFCFGAGKCFLYSLLLLWCLADLFPERICCCRGLSGLLPREAV